MKKFTRVIGLLCACVVLASCASREVKGSGVKGKEADMVKRNVKILDYQGSTFGKEVPQWVMLVAEGQYSSQVLKEVMPDVAGKKTFVTIGRGDNLEFVENWTDMVDVEVQVGDTIQRVVGKAVEATMKGGNKEVADKSEPTEIERTMNMYKQAVSAVELNGLEKKASYWVKRRVYDIDDRNSFQDDYEYYAVWAMDEKVFNRQLEAALQSVESNTSEGEALKQILRQKLESTVVVSNNNSVNDSADEIIFSF